MLHNLSQTDSNLQELVALLRDRTRQNNRELFRDAIRKIGFILGYEISKTLNFKDAQVETPLGNAKTRKIKDSPVVASILRAGLPLHNGLLEAFPESDNCFIGAYRKHAHDGSFTIQLDYLASPNLKNRTLILADPMLATGASLIATLAELLKKDTPAAIHIAAVIASTSGINALVEHYPNVHIWVTAVDEKLNDKDYIVPGLGDAGDLAFGETAAR